MIVGNDVSTWQGDINFDILKNNAHFIIIKTSEGTGFTDAKFRRNKAEARRVGLLLGYYHFARPDLGNSPEAEAESFLLIVGDLRDGEMLCLDYEPASNPFPVVDWCKRFLDFVFMRTGCKPLLYLNKSQVRGFNWKPVVDAGYGLWLASYDGDVYTGPWTVLAMQQWTSSQKVPGISNGTGNVDGNYFFGDESQFKAYGYHVPVVASSSTSPSVSPSGSKSPSVSPSSSPSPSRSPSPSVSPSPSPSPSMEDIDVCENKLFAVTVIVASQWTWFGKNVWYKKLAMIKKILSA